MSKDYKQLITETHGGTAVFTFGRFNPPTIGHEKLLTVVANAALKERGDYYVFMSHSQDSKKNPLSHQEKFKFMQMLFPKHRRALTKTKARHAMEVATQLYDMGKYSKLMMVVGSDRVEEFNKILKQYNGEKNKHGFYDFKQIKVISAGERDPDAEGAEGISASKMRAAVVAGDYDSFKMGVPSGTSERDCHKLWDATKKGMNIREDINMEEEQENDENLLEEFLLETLFLSDEEFDILIGNDVSEKYKKATGGYDMRKMQVQRKLALRAKKKQKASTPAKKTSVKKSPSKGLTPAMRRKMGLRMKILAKKPAFIMKRLRSMKRAATKQKLTQRARRQAIKDVVKKFYPKLRTKKKSELSYAERGKISDIVKKKAKVIARFARRLVKDKRKQDVERRKSANKPKEK